MDKINQLIVVLIVLIIMPISFVFFAITILSKELFVFLVNKVKYKCKELF
jgi:hypothetical protein